MKMIVRNLLSLNSLKKARVIAGNRGIYNSIHGATILEIAGDEISGAAELLAESAKSQDIMISALYTVKDDISKQCKTIESMYHANVSGLIVFYYGRIIKEFSSEVIQLCDRLNFPLIVIDYEENKGISYEDVMKEIFAMLKQQDEYLHRKAISTMWKEWENGATAKDVFRIISRFTLSDVIIASFTSKQILLSTEDMYDENAVKKVIEESLKGNHGVLIKEGSDSYLAENYHSEKLNAIIILKTNSKNKFEDWMFSCVKLCVDIYNDELSITGNDEIIKLLVEGNFNIDTPILNESPESKWGFFIIENKKDRLFTSLTSILDSGKVAYLNGMFKSYKVILFTDDNNFYKVQDEIKELFTAEQTDICVYVKQIRDKAVMMQLLRHAIEMFNYYNVVFPFRQIIEKPEIKILIQAVKVVADDEKYLEEDVLEPIKDFDKAHNGRLMETLQAFMVDFNGDYYKTGQYLFVHKNTIQYRINSIMEILNFNLKDNSQMFYLYSALITERIKKII